MSTSFPFHFEELDNLLKRFSGNTDKRKIQIQKILKEAYRLRRKDTCEPFMPASEAEWINFFFSPGIIRKNTILEQCQVYFPVRLDDCCSGSTVSSSKSGVKIQGYSDLNYRQKSIEVTRLEKLFFNCSRILDILAHSFISGTPEAGFVKKYRKADKPISTNIDTLELIEKFIGRFRPSAQEKDNPVLFFEKICRSLCVTVNPLIQHRSSGTITIDPQELQKDGFVLKNSDSIYTPNKWLVLMENKIFLLSSIVFLKKNGKLKVIRLQAETKKISKLMRIYSKLIAAEQRYQGPEFYDTFKKFFVKNFALINTSKNKPFKYKDTRDLALKFVVFDRLTLYLVPELYEPLQQKYSITRDEYNSKINEYNKNKNPSSGTLSAIKNYAYIKSGGYAGTANSIENLKETQENVKKNIGLICASTAGKCLNQFSYKDDDENEKMIDIYPEETKQIFTFRYSCKFLKKQETELVKENFFEYSHFDEEKSGVERKKNIEDISDHIKKAFVKSLIFSNEIAIAYASFFHEFISFGILEVELLPVNLTPEEINSITKINKLPKYENKFEELFKILKIDDNNEDDKNIKDCLKSGQSAIFLVKKDTKFYKVTQDKGFYYDSYHYSNNNNTNYLKNLENQGVEIKKEEFISHSIAYATAAATIAASAGGALLFNLLNNNDGMTLLKTLPVVKTLPVDFQTLLDTQDTISDELKNEIKENLVYTLKPIDKKEIEDCLLKVTDKEKVKKILIALRLLNLFTIKSYKFFNVPETNTSENKAAISYTFKKFKYEEYFKILSRFYKNYTKHMTDGVLFTFNKLMNSQELFQDMHRMTEDCICQKRFKVGIVQLLDQFKPTAPTMQLTGPDEVLLIKVLKLDNDLITKSLSNKEKFFENVCDHITRENEYLLKIKPVLYHKLVAINKVKIIRVILDAFKYIRKVLIEQNNKMGLDFILKENLIIFQIMNQHKEKGFVQFIWSKFTPNNFKKVGLFAATALIIASMFAPPPPDENLPPLNILDWNDESITPNHPEYGKAKEELTRQADAATKIAQNLQNKLAAAKVDSQFKVNAYDLIPGVLSGVSGALTGFFGGLASGASTLAGIASDNPWTSVGLAGLLSYRLYSAIHNKYYQQKVSTSVTPTVNEMKIATEIKTREKLAHHAQKLIQRGKHDEVLSDDIIQAFNNVMEMYKNSSKIIFQHKSIIPENIVFINSDEYNYSQKRKEKLEAQNETDFSINEKLEAYINSQVAQLTSAYEALPEAERAKINQSNWKNGIIENFFSLATQGFSLYNIYGALTSGSFGYAGQTLLGLTHNAYRTFSVDHSTNNSQQPFSAANRRINDAHPKPHNDAKHRDAVNHYLRYANHRA